MPNSIANSGTRYGVNFATTLWPMIMAAQAQGSSDAARAALERLCQTYWYPIYGFLRRHGRSVHEAEDLTQGFFSHLLHSGALLTVDQEKGKFRSFLLRVLKNYVADERDKTLAQKRGGNQTHIALDSLDGEERLALEPVERMDPEKLFDRAWALSLLETVLKQLRAEYQTRQRGDWFQHIGGFLFEGRGSYSQAHVAKLLGVKESAVSSEVFRMRQRYRELFREEIARTVRTLDQVDAEMRHLLAALLF